MTTAFDIVDAIKVCCEDIRTDRGYLTDAGLNVQTNLPGRSSPADVHPMVVIVWPGQDKELEYPGQVRQLMAGEFQVFMEFKVQPVDDLSAARAAYLDLTRALFGPDSQPVLRNIVSGVEIAGASHFPRQSGGTLGQVTVHLLIRWIENIGQE